MVSAREDALMAHWMEGKTKSPLLAALILGCGMMLAGCDDHISAIRDTDIPVPKGSTWAWRPVAASREADRRPVVSRDVLSRGETIVRDPGANNDIVRQRIRTAIEQPLSSKGLRQVRDPRAPAFPGEYAVGARRHDVTG